ncbi:TetR/AcrR family transcriptional regulator [uncultured Cohaesibacter sp.]|uniref:TetR/AcrR family transcriptional regulator n=1 Tax=uncultured Cohaesibacter sp. TaxID=1002546 RepID=UPI0029C8A31F|nr:TetR/AcrR family transcriptional regulator [uncultured Cohaesibacter sp.]
MENRKRARSEDQKEARRADILDAARAMIMADGFDGVTMNALASRAGLSKGTLYLYVRSKEELFLWLFVDAMEQLVEQIEAEATRENLPTLMGQAPQEVPLFLPLLARLAAVIETNVADDPLFEAKRIMWRLGARVTDVIARLTGASQEEAGEAASILMMAMQGAAQFDITARRPLDTVPDDMREIYTSQTFARRFPSAARMILGGLMKG